MGALFALVLGPQHSVQSLAQTWEIKTRRHEREKISSMGQSLRSVDFSYGHRLGMGRGVGGELLQELTSGVTSPNQRGPVTRRRLCMMYSVHGDQHVPTLNSRGLFPAGWWVTSILHTRGVSLTPKGQNPLWSLEGQAK